MECFLHYKLELNNTSQFAVAQRLLLLDRWESVINKRKGRVDISSRGNASHFRNELHAGQPLRSGSVAEWTLPEADEFELDYVSSKRPTATAKALTDELWERLMAGDTQTQPLPRDAVWQKIDGSFDDFQMGIPRSWENVTPTSGIFKCRYVCSADDRNVAWRKALAQTLGSQGRGTCPKNDSTTSNRKDVNWLTGLNEPPQDVLDLLEFFISRVKDMDEAFNIIDGGEPGCTSNSESLGQKFEGSDEQARIAAVFRYLDPGGEGTVSLKAGPPVGPAILSSSFPHLSAQEWSVLDQLWQEFDAWDALDEDGSGSLTEEEFNEAVQAAGYFGPARVVFALLDGSDDGEIALDELLVLKASRTACN
eukprot:Skav217671  [mRNA]  locus=scaffold2919:261400:275320:+ [translate_table: standard]